MATKKQRRPGSKPKLSTVEREEQETERVLRRNVARQKRVRVLSRQLITAIAATDFALQRVVRLIRERVGDDEPSTN